VLHNSHDVLCLVLALVLLISHKIFVQNFLPRVIEKKFINMNRSECTVHLLI